MNCSVEGCALAFAAKGFCHLHYKRWRRHGDPTVAQRMVPRGSTVNVRLDIRIDKRGPDECWPWTGATRRGYGVMQVGKITKGAHVWSYTEANGPVPDGLFVLHSCDNPPCCNPAHLRAGTNDENMADKVERGRVFRPLGERGPAKITEKQAVEIITRYAAGGISTAKLAPDYGISKAQILNIVTGRRWPHLGGVAGLERKKAMT